VRVASFLMDRFEVTNAEFASFLEHHPEWQRDRIPERYHNGEYLRHWTAGFYPTGQSDHPVTHVPWYAARAYCQAAGKRLPTEAEWEFAARGGLEGRRYNWGDEPSPGGRQMANIFHGDFPHHQTTDDGYAATSPVGTFPPNGYGLVDMAGNVWQWTADLYRADEFSRRAGNEAMCDNPQGPTSTYDPADPYAVRRVIKGGSFLCHVTYCESYRPSARRGTPPDTGSAHVGFRLVKDATRTVAANRPAR
jgi:formylglycine-generating enzyme required for sulfatase activity